tara:strand:- start:16 stop:135 length:120 start_codon:yes stop_codon:yes gene_type:complete
MKLLGLGSRCSGLAARFWVMKALLGLWFFKNLKQYNQLI